MATAFDAAADSFGNPKAIVRRAFDEALNRGELSVLDECWATDMVNYSGVSSVDDIRRWIVDVRRTFPDLYVEVQLLIAEGDLVASRERWRGTHTKTGERVDGVTQHFFRFSRGLVAEEWSEGWAWLEGIEVIDDSAGAPARRFDRAGNIVSA